jgi:hypothetical protein
MQPSCKFQILNFKQYFLTKFFFQFYSRTILEQVRDSICHQVLDTGKSVQFVEFESRGVDKEEDDNDSSFQELSNRQDTTKLSFLASSPHSGSTSRTPIQNDLSDELNQTIMKQLGHAQPLPQSEISSKNIQSFFIK